MDPDPYPDPYSDPYWPPSGSSGSGSVKNEYGSETLLFSLLAGLWIRNVFFLDPDPTFQMVSDPDPVSVPSWMFSSIFNTNLPLYPRPVSVLGCILRRGI